MTPRQALLKWPSYRLFPYERELARREAASLLHCQPSDSEDGLLVELNGHPNEVLGRLTYFREVQISDGTSLVPTQATLEASAQGPRASTRQSTRYSAHGLHEYRGKFNPQIVRAIGNLLDLEDESAVLDPFCGSGTTLLECLHSDWHAVGIDLNPLAVAIANAKLSFVRASSRRIKADTARLSAHARETASHRDFSRAWTPKEIATLLGGSGSDPTLENAEYLARWIQPSVMAQLVWTLNAIEKLAGQSTRQIFRLVLSDLLRSASLQDPGDLRIRRRKDPSPNEPLLVKFADAIERNSARVIEAKLALGSRSTRQRAVLSDSRDPRLVERAALRCGAPIRAVISSPPYATALPYIDTQRLSLCALGLVDWRRMNRVERQLIGTRELTVTERGRIEQRMQTVPGSLHRVAKLCIEMMRALSPADGFRRRNMPAVTFQYFEGMSAVLSSLPRVLGGGADLAFVVGPNTTTLGGRTFRVNTPHLLAEMSEMLGWKVRDLLPLETYQRFDIHNRNSIKSEALLLLRSAD